MNDYTCTGLLILQADITESCIWSSLLRCSVQAQQAEEQLQFFSRQHVLFRANWSALRQLLEAEAKRLKDRDEKGRESERRKLKHLLKQVLPVLYHNAPVQAWVC